MSNSVDIARRGGQRSVEVTRRVAQRVEVAVKPRAGVEQFDLVREALLGVAGADLGGEHPLARDRQVRTAISSAHAVAGCAASVGVNSSIPSILAVEPALAHRVADMERLPRVEVLHGLLQQEPRGALVDPDSGKGGDVDETDRRRGIYFVSSTPGCGCSRRLPGRDGAGRQAFGDLLQRGSHRDNSSSPKRFRK